MVNQINDIASQASSGSIAAIIQILNEKLASSGVRTRAMFDSGVLQLLCEARTIEKLDKLILIQQIRQILESIAPRNIHKVNVNSRIVREQQLLWLEEINRDRENQVLWSEEIILKRPNILRQIIKDFNDNKNESQKLQLPQAKISQHLIVNKSNKNRTSFAGRLLNIVSLCTFILVAGGIAYSLMDKTNNPLKKLISKASTSDLKSLNSRNIDSNINQTKLQTPVKDIYKTNLQSKDDFFAVAVRIANQAVKDGKTVETSAEWLDLAAKWQRASDLMAEVPSSHSRFKEAESRVQLYKKYSESALNEANKKKQF